MYLSEQILLLSINSYKSARREIIKITVVDVTWYTENMYNTNENEHVSK